MKLKFDWKALIVPAGFILLAVGLIVANTLVAGCRLSDAIRVPVPSAVQKATGLSPVVTLTESEAAWEAWQFHVSQASEQFAGNIADAQEVFGFVSSLLNTGIGQLEGPIGAAIPGGALLFGALTGTLGLITKKPGTDKLIHKEKEDSYAKGLEEGKKAILESLRNGTPT